MRMGTFLLILPRHSNRSGSRLRDSQRLCASIRNEDANTSSPWCVALAGVHRGDRASPDRVVESPRITAPKLGSVAGLPKYAAEEKTRNAMRVSLLTRAGHAPHLW